MRKVIYAKPFANITETPDGGIMELFTLNEVLNYPNMSKKEADLCEYLYDDDVAGFAKDRHFDENYPSFTQIYYEEIEEIK